METVYKDWESFRLWVTTKRLHKGSKKGLLLGKDFDEWLSMGGDEFLWTLMRYDDEFELDKSEKSSGQEHRLIYAKINNVKSLVGYADALRDEISHYEEKSWGRLSAYMPVYTDKITGYSGWVIMELIRFEKTWELIKEENKGRLDKARKKFND